MDNMEISEFNLERVFQNEAHLRYFIESYQDQIGMNLRVFYSLLRGFKDYSSEQRDIFVRNRLFQWAFAGFFDMRIDNLKSADIFFGKMYDLKDKVREEEIKPKEIAEQMKKDGLKCIEFVFTTKMLHMLDGNKFPIYDDNVRVAFGLAVNKKEDSLHYKERVYETMKIRYSNWASQYGKYLDEVAHSMGCDGVSRYKVIDSVVWLLGRSIKQTNKKKAKQKNENQNL